MLWADRPGVGRWAQRRAAVPWTWVAVAAVFLFVALTNWAWLRTNVVTLGWDRIAHLETSLLYFDVLRDLHPRTLFNAWTLEGYYPPLVHLLAVGAYHLFGRSSDVAAATMVVWLLVLLIAVYSIAKRLWGSLVGVLTVVLLALFPMIFALSRYLYLDFPLAAAVAASIAALLHTGRFHRRAPSLLFGLSLGLGFLTKWSFAFFLVAPVALTLLVAAADDAQFLRAPLKTLRAQLLAPGWRPLLVAVAVGALLAIAFTGAALDRVRMLRLGLALLPVLTVVFSVAIYSLRLPQRHWLTNAASACLLGLALASTWALPRLDFLDMGLWVTYGKPHGRFWGFGPYLSHLVFEQISPFLVAVFLASALWLVWQRWSRARGLRPFLAIGYERALLLAWVVVPYFLLSWRTSTIQSRYMMPILPPLAMVIAVALGRLRPPRLRAAAVGLVLAVALLQFVALSYDSLAPVRRAAVVALPGRGEFNLLASGYSLQLPSSGDTDRGYWVVPTVFERMERWRQAAGVDRATLGLIFASYQLNEHHFESEVAMYWPRLDVRELARGRDGSSVYAELFGTDFVVLSDNPNWRVTDESQAATERILHRPDDLFHAAFELDWSAVLPSGERTFLYRRRYLPQAVAPTGEDRALVEAIRSAATTDTALVLAPGSLAFRVGAAGGVEVPVVGVVDPAPPDTLQAALDEAAGTHTRLLVLARRGEAGELPAIAEAWLAQNAFVANSAWFGDLLLLAAGLDEPPAEPERLKDAQFGSALTLATVRVPDRATAGSIVPLLLHWRAENLGATDLKLFAHLLTPEGLLVAQRDVQLGAALTDASAEFTSRVGLLLPSDLPAGDYSVTVGVYDSATGERLPVEAGLPIAEPDGLLVKSLSVAD